MVGALMGAGIACAVLAIYLDVKQKPGPLWAMWLLAGLAAACVVVAVILGEN